MSSFRPREETMEQRSNLGEENPVTRASELLAKIPVLRNNQIELLVDGQQTFDSIFEGIDAAKEYILVQFFIVKDDELGRELKSRLLARARAGVRVYFLYDEVGSHDLPKSYLEELREAGAEIVDFHTRKGPSNRFQINFRNHRKIVVVDGHTAWVGGHNVGDEYMGRDPEFGHWRDTHVKIVGPAVIATQVSFLEDWHWATNKVPEFNWTPHVPDRTGRRRSDVSDRPLRPSGDRDADVPQRDQRRQGETLDRQPLFRARRVDHERAPPCRPARRRRSHHHPGQGGPPDGLSGRLFLFRRGPGDRHPFLPLHGWFPPPEGGIGR